MSQFTEKITMKDNKLIPLEEAAKEWFTKEEIKKLDREIEGKNGIKKKGQFAK
jgi:hypothetical protein